MRKLKEIGFVYERVNELHCIPYFATLVRNAFTKYVDIRDISNTISMSDVIHFARNWQLGFPIDDFIQVLCFLFLITKKNVRFVRF